MTFADLALHDSVFLDANTLVYHFASHQVFGPAANQLMTRIENQELVGYTSTHMLSETAHRLMMIEAATLPGWKQTKVKPAAVISQQTGLLSNDALVVSAMQAHALTCLASNDPDFDRVPGITRFAPV